MEERIRNTIEHLEQNGFQAVFCETVEEAKERLLADIAQEKSIGFGSSMTLIDMGMPDEFLKKGNKVFYHGTAKSPEDRKQQLAGAASADVYFSSSNAITEDGRLVNIDGSGNRLSGILFGHERVYIVAGKNKIVRNIEEALLRIKNQACPKNTERLGFNTPCRVTGRCENCDSPQRICNATLIMDRQMSGAHTTVYIINENLGY